MPQDQTNFSSRFSWPPAGSGSAGGNNVKDKCPPNKRAFFNALGSIIKGMAEDANTNPDFIAALSAYESGWLGSHAQDLHNPFGLTNAGGNDLSFSSYQAAANFWLYDAGRSGQGYAAAVSGTNTIGSFLNAANKAGYNAATASWASDITKVYKTSILPFKKDCGF